MNKTELALHLKVWKWERTQGIRNQVKQSLFNILKIRNPSMLKDYKDEEPKKDKTL